MTQQNYNLTNIRELLLQGFDEGELRALCFDMPSFRPVYHELAANTGKAEIVAKLLAHADKTMQLDTLLTLARDRNPARYQRHGPYLISPAATPTGPAGGSSGVNIGRVEGGIHGSTLSGGDVHQTYHINVQGGLTMGDQFNMSGDFRGAILNIKNKMENVTQTVNAISGDDSTKAELEQLLKQLSETLQQVPPERTEDAEAVAETAKDLVEKASQEKPNKSLIKISGEGLKQAAQNLAAVMPPVLGIATQIVAAVLKLTGG
jgi:hypothetical protein